MNVFMLKKADWAYFIRIVVSAVQAKVTIISKNKMLPVARKESN